MRMSVTFTGINFSLAILGGLSSSLVVANEFTQALSQGKAYGDFNLRYESVEQDNTLEDASALLLRSRLGYVTNSYYGFSAGVEFEDVSIVAGVDQYTVGPTGFHPGEYSLIADPESTEVDQSFIQYESESTLTKVGRQVVTLDNHRFVGHVGFRQDRQTFDAFSTVIDVTENFTARVMFFTQRNWIFADAGDQDSKDQIVNLSYKTPLGNLVGYAYLLERDDQTDNSLDTYGLRFSGQTQGDNINFLYTAEYATQESINNTLEFDTEYMFAEAGFAFKGFSVKAGVEVLGSDEGNFGFSTPLATMHKFNGWADQFLATPAQGLVDASVSIHGPLLGGKWSVVYHEFEADEASDTVDDLGDELDVSYLRKLGKHFTVGVKYASYTAGDIKVDTDKLWVWTSFRF